MLPHVRPLLTLLALAAVPLVGLGSSADPSGAARATTTTGVASAAAESATSGVRLARVKSGLKDALLVTSAPGQPKRLYIVQQGGRVLILQNGRLQKTPFLDISHLTRGDGEQGLLGLAFHPKYATNGRFYVDYTNLHGDTRVVEYRRANANRANPKSARRLLAIAQPYANHNGGNLAFGPDGRLYVGMGDGGGGGDPQGNGQRVDTLLGKILRIDVNTRTGSLPYGIPADNPYAGGGGRREIYAYGLRNPWRFSFDRTTGDIWIGDVGQDEIEEVDYRPVGGARGANFGWNAYEGSRPFSGGSPVRGSTPAPPVAEYTHADGCSITGGYVYRGGRVPALAGRYVYADFCSGRVWSMRAGPGPGDVREETSRLGVSLSNVTSFGQGLAGDLYVIAGGTLYRFVR